MSIEKAIELFHSDILILFAHVERVLFHVTQLNISSVPMTCLNNYYCVFKADLRYVCDTGSEWVCNTCTEAWSDATAS